MVRKIIQNAASKEILADVMRRKGIKFSKIKVLSKSGEGHAGRYEVTLK